jgi:large subunit ribosomal protein L25
MENILKINGDERSGFNKSITKSLRKEGKIPAVIYGISKESIPFSINYSDAKKILDSELGENTILEILIGKDKINGMVQEMQWDYLGDTIIHIDFLKIDISKRVKVSIPIILKGEPIGCRVEDGLLDFVTRDILVSCFPGDILKQIELDVSELHIGQSLKIGQLDLSDKIELLSNPEIVICIVAGKAEEETVEEEEEEDILTEEGEEEGTSAESKDSEKSSES